MAIDTRDKRASAIGIAGPFRSLLPNPDVGAEDQGDRQQMSFVYRGINVGAFYAAVVRTGRFRMHVYNLVTDPDVVLSSTTENAAYPLSNLQNPLISRPYKATSNTAQRIVLDLNNVNAGLREATDVILAIHNLTTDAVVKVESNATNVWTTPTFTITKSVPEDLETNAGFWQTWMDRPPGLIDFNSRAVRNLYYPLAVDVAGDRYISVYIDDPTNLNPISIGKLFFGWGLQFAVNFDWGWGQGFVDHGHVVAGLPSFSRVSVSDIFSFRMSFVQRADARIARYLNYRIGKRYCFLSVEPENDDAMTDVSTVGSDFEIRQHTMTVYGILDLPRLTEKNLMWLHDFDANFEAIGVPALPGNTEAFENDDDVIPGDDGGGGGGGGGGGVGQTLVVREDITDISTTSGVLKYIEAYDSTLKNTKSWDVSAGKIIIGADGDYDFGCTVFWEPDTTGYETEVFIQKNRASNVAIQKGFAPGAKADATHLRAMPATGSESFVEGDVLEVAGRQFFGGSRLIKKVIFWLKGKSELTTSQGCFIRQGTATNFAPSGGAFSSAITFSGAGSIVKNDDGYFSAAAPAEFTIQNDGCHFVTVSAISNQGNWGGASSDGCQMHLLLNGVPISGDTIRMSDQSMGGPGSPNNPQQALNCCILYPFIEADVLTVKLAQSDSSSNMQLAAVNVAIKLIEESDPHIDPEVRLQVSQTTDVVVGTLTGNSVHNKDLFDDATNYTEVVDSSNIWNGSSNVVTPGVAGWVECWFAHTYTSNKDGSANSIDSCSQNMYIESATLGYRIAERGHRAGFFGDETSQVSASVRQMIYISATDTVKLGKTRVWSVVGETGVITSKTTWTKCLLQYLGA